MIYEAHETTLSLFVFDELDDEGCEEHHGHHVGHRRHGQRTLSLVGALPAEELDRLVREARL